AVLGVGPQKTRTRDFCDRLDEFLLQPLRDAAADHDHLGIEHVHDVAGEKPEIVLCASQDFPHHGIAGVERLLDHAAGHPIFSAFLHDLEHSALRRSAHIALHRGAARERFDASLSPATALRAVFLDHHVADFAGRASKTLVDFAVDDQAAADARAHPHAHGALRSFGGAVAVLTEDGDL